MFAVGPKNEAKFWSWGGLAMGEGLMAQKMDLLAIRPNRSEIVSIAMLDSCPNILIVHYFGTNSLVPTLAPIFWCFSGDS